MFLDSGHLEQGLPPESYVSEQRYHQELRELFLPGWQWVGLRSQLDREGTYLTADLFGRPIIVWRSGGELHAFLNVGAHRFSTLTDRPCGQMERLKCQYHGWEYDSTGATRKIPDAAGFRPLSEGCYTLTKLPAATCGQLVFVSFGEQTFEEHLGPGYDLCSSWFGEEHLVNGSRVWDVKANW